MKKTFTKILLVFCSLCFVVTCACSPVDRTNSSETESTTTKTDYSNVKIPEISSEDTVMPTYFDISLYNAQNFAEIYLGKNFKLKTTYCGVEFDLPCTYKDMLEKDFTLVGNEEYAENSIILAGKSLKVRFKNELDKEIIAVFNNSSNSSVELKKCRIVKMIIPQNSLYNENSMFDEFWVNGINNHSAITDIVEYLGAPSHFYAVNETSYYFDYYISQKDLRPAIRVFVDPREDVVTSIEFAKYN